MSDELSPCVVQVKGAKYADEEDHRYGCGAFKPGWLQWLGNIKVYVGLTAFLCFWEGFAVNGVTNAAIVPIEKQFGLTSSISGWVSSAHDIGAFLVLLLLVIFMGDRHNKARVTALGALGIMLGTFTFLIPHMATQHRPAESVDVPTALCVTGQAVTAGGTAGGGDGGGSAHAWLALFMFANGLSGAGFTPMTTVGTVYIDDNENEHTAAVYVGLTYAMTGIGVAVGFFATGQMTENLYVDFDYLDQDKLTFGPRDPAWVGAWWLGFIPACIAMGLVFLPLYAFPRSLPSGDTREEKILDSTENEKSVCQTIKAGFLQFFSDSKKLLLNGAFMALAIGAAAVGHMMAGIATYSFKYLTEQYDMPYDEAGNVVGGLVLVGSVCMFMGGVVIKVLKLGARGMAVMLALLMVASGLLSLSLLADCREVDLAGLQRPYPGDTSRSNYSSACQGDCACAGSLWDPVCGQDGAVYFSPCHAGCSAIRDEGPYATFHNCSCVALAQNVSVASPDARASKARCAVPCDNRYILLPCLFLMFSCMLLASTPNCMGVLRVVDPSLRTFAFGFFWIIIRLIGSIPGPPSLGAVMDHACLVWEQGEGGFETCMLYSKRAMSRGLLLWWALTTLVALVSYLVALFIIARRERNAKATDMFTKTKQQHQSYINSKEDIATDTENNNVTA